MTTTNQTQENETTKELNPNGAKIGCCCPIDDAEWCVALRYGKTRPSWNDGLEPERCECVCHEDEEDSGYFLDE